MKSFLTDPIKREIKRRCDENPNEECCGFITRNKNGLKIIPCENIDTEPSKSFFISREETVAAQKIGEIVCCYHSHTDSDLNFSPLDIAVSNRTNVEYILYAGNDFKTHTPTGRHAAYTGRPFYPGIFDCFTLLEDYYKNEFNIELTKMNHKLRFVQDWKKHISLVKTSQNVIQNYLKENGFKKCNNMNRGAVVLLKTKLNFPTHMAIIQSDKIILDQTNEGSSYNYFSQEYKNDTVCTMEVK